MGVMQRNVAALLAALSLVGAAAAPAATAPTAAAAGAAAGAGAAAAADDARPPPPLAHHQRRLRFRADGSFIIAQLADLHYGESPERDANTSRVQSTVLAAERPDLVVFSGDQISGFCSRGETGDDPPAPGWVAAQWPNVTAAARAARVPHATVLGNHDDQADLTRRGIVELDIATGRPLALARLGPPDNNVTGQQANYYLNVYGPRRGGGGDRVEARLWVLDSGDTACGHSTRSWGCVPPETVAWLRATAAGLEEVGTQVMYVHIPFPEVRRVWQAGGPGLRGSKGEPVSCPLVNTGAFDAAKDIGVQAIFFGHDHDDDYEGVYKGVRLAFGRKTGYGSYGPPEGVQKGARVLQLRLGESAAEAATWIRQEDGSTEYQAPPREPRGGAQRECDPALGAPAGGRWLPAAAAAAAAALGARLRWRTPPPAWRWQRLADVD